MYIEVLDNNTQEVRSFENVLTIAKNENLVITFLDGSKKTMGYHWDIVFMEISKEK